MPLPWPPADKVTIAAVSTAPSLAKSSSPPPPPPRPSHHRHGRAPGPHSRTTRQGEPNGQLPPRHATPPHAGGDGVSVIQLRFTRWGSREQPGPRGPKEADREGSSLPAPSTQGRPLAAPRILPKPMKAAARTRCSALTFQRDPAARLQSSTHRHAPLSFTCRPLRERRGS